MESNQSQSRPQDRGPPWNDRELLAAGHTVTFEQVELPPQEQHRHHRDPLSPNRGIVFDWLETWEYRGWPDDDGFIWIQQPRRRWHGPYTLWERIIEPEYGQLRHVDFKWWQGDWRFEETDGEQSPTETDIESGDAAPKLWDIHVGPEFSIPDCPEGTEWVPFNRQGQYRLEPVDATADGVASDETYYLV